MRHIHTLATIPPMILNDEEKERKFFDYNGIERK